MRELFTNDHNVFEIDLNFATKQRLWVKGVWSRFERIGEKLLASWIEFELFFLFKDAKITGTAAVKNWFKLWAFFQAHALQGRCKPLLQPL